MKRYTGFGTGWCQGKWCLALCARLIHERGGDVDKPITPRPPYHPVPLAALAGLARPRRGRGRAGVDGGRLLLQNARRHEGPARPRVPLRGRAPAAQGAARPQVRARSTATATASRSPSPARSNEETGWFIDYAHLYVRPLDLFLCKG